MQVERECFSLLEQDSGARVSNAYAIYLIEGNSPGKLGLMPHGITKWHHFVIKDPSL